MLTDLITILGPTASGKTRLAASLAKDFNGEIISADSRQVYRRMNIGTGKDLHDYTVNGSQVVYHLIDIIDPEDEFNLFEFKRRFYQALELIKGRKKLPFLVGGTGLYLSSILQNYKLKKADFSSCRAKELQHFSPDKLKEILLSIKSGIHNKTDLVDKERLIKAILIAETESADTENIPLMNSVVIGIKAEREIIKTRITERLKKRLDAGMIAEVEDLIESGISFEKLDFFGLEYRYIGLYLKGDLNFNDMFQKLNSAISNFAKRQMTWFRKMEREGIKINWIEASDYSKARQIIMGKVNV
jgi:tRNA dimethylallyltransferase